MTVFVWLVLSTIWGTTWLFIKLGLEGLPPFTFAGVRFMVALVPLTLLLYWRKPPLPQNRADWRLVFTTGILTITVNYGLVFWGENYISSALTAIFYSTYPLLGLLIAHLLLPLEKMTWMKTAGVILGIAGVAIIFANQIVANNLQTVLGAAAVIVAAGATAYASVLIKSRGTHLDPLVLTVGQMGFGFLPLVVLGLVLEGAPWSFDWNIRAMGALLYLAFIGSSLAFVLVYWLIQRMDVTKTQLIPLASTLIAVVLGKLVLQERLNLRILIGGLSILTGLALNVWGHQRQRRRELLLQTGERRQPAHG